MGLAAVRHSETEDVEITVDNDSFYGDVAVVVELFPSTNEARVDSSSHGGKPFALEDADKARAIEAAWRKREEA